jgi:hypothetical protein
MLYYNSQLKDYFDLYSDAKKAIKSWDYSINWRWKEIVINNISSLFNKKYEIDAQLYFIQKISEILPEEIDNKLSYLKELYTHKNLGLEWLWQ